MPWAYLSEPLGAQRSLELAGLGGHTTALGQWIR